MKRTLLISLCACLLLFLSAVVVSAQEKQETVKVRLRVLPVTVVGSDGEPVRGLKAEDFELLIDGEPAQIRSVDEYDYAPLRKQVEAGGEVAGAAADLPPRRVILIFDLLSSSLIGSEDNPRVRDTSKEFANASQRSGDKSTDNRNRTKGITSSKAAARAWVESDMLPSDEVAVIQYGTNAGILQTYTSDRQAVIAAIEKVDMPIDLIGRAADEVSSRDLRDNPDDSDLEVVFESQRGEGADSVSTASMPYEPSVVNFTSLDVQISSYYGNYVEFFRRLGRLLAGVPGTKDVILFSEGIALQRNVESNTLQDAFDDAVDALASSNSRVTVISISGIDQASMASVGKSFLNQVASETGGSYYPDRARLDGVLTEAVDKLDHYYELFFSPAPQEAEGFHSVDVRLKKEGARVDAPNGYLGDTRYDQMSSVQAEIRMAQGFWMPLKNELGGEMTWRLLPYGDNKAALHIRAFIPADELPEAGRTDFDAFLSIGQGGEKLDEVYWSVKRTPGEDPVQLDFAVPVASGVYSIQFLVMDRADGDRAYLISGVQAGAAGTGTTMGPLYISATDAETPKLEVEFKRPPAVLNQSIPETLQRMIAVPEVDRPRGGRIVSLSFVFRGAEFEQAGAQFRRGEQISTILGQQLKQEPLENGFRLVSYQVQIPDWGPGPLTLTPLYLTGGKTYGLPSTDITMR